MRTEKFTKYTLLESDLIGISDKYINESIERAIKIKDSCVEFRNTSPDGVILELTIPLWMAVYDYIEVTEIDIIQETIENINKIKDGSVIFFAQSPKKAIK